jgi:hypothetical protein
VWATRRGGGVTLSTHLDTVPPYVPPRLEGTRLYGRGSSDAKGIAEVLDTPFLTSGGVGVVSSWSVSPSVTSLTLTPTAALVGLTMTAALQTNTAGVIDLNCTAAATGVGRAAVRATTSPVRASRPAISAAASTPSPSRTCT